VEKQIRRDLLTWQLNSNPELNINSEFDEAMDDGIINDIADIITLHSVQLQLERRRRYLSENAQVQNDILMRLNRQCLDLVNHALKKINWKKYGITTIKHWQFIARPMTHFPY
jgi:hypothetical protein